MPDPYRALPPLSQVASQAASASGNGSSKVAQLTADLAELDRKMQVVQQRLEEQCAATEKEKAEKVSRQGCLQC